MKKIVCFLFAFVFLIFSAVMLGSCSLGSEKTDGVYYLIFSTEVNEGQLEFKTTDDMEFDTYVKINNLTIEIFVFKKDTNSVKVLESYSKTIKTKKEFMPTFDVETYDGQKVYREYTNMTGSLESNPGKQLFKQYIKIDSNEVPSFHQSGLLGYFGDYELDANHKITLNGKLFKTDNSVEVVYSFLKSEENNWFYKAGSEEIKFSFVSGKLRLFGQDGISFSDYSKV